MAAPVNDRRVGIRLCAALACSAAVVAAQAPSRLRVEYMESPLTVDVPAPRFSYALDHPQRAQAQTAYQIRVADAAAGGGGGGGGVVWDSGRVASNRSLNLRYAGAPLRADADYEWTVTYWDAAGEQSAPASATFSTALPTPAAWMGAQWLSSPANGSLNTYRAEFTVAAPVVRARLYVSGLGYHKAWLNGALTDDHELGQFVTFEKRVLYSVVDVTPLVRVGCNALGVMVGHGWFAEPSVAVGARQFIALVSVTTADGATAYFPSSSSGSGSGSSSSSSSSSSSVTQLTFSATAGPVSLDNIYLGESFDGRVWAAISGWASCGFAPGAAWVPAVEPAASPATMGAVLESRKLEISTAEDFPVAPGGIVSPALNEYTFDFAQNMAGQLTLTVSDCPAGTVITMSQAEMVFANGSVNNIYANSPMRAVYTCAGGGGTEVYRTLFTYFGFRYSQLSGFPGTPDEGSLVAHYVHSAAPPVGDFASSSALLNAVQHATRYAFGSNMMDVPTDCPQRERRGWLGDAQLTVESVLHNFDGAVFYRKWLRDFVDAQVFSNETMGGGGAMPDCVPYYSHGHVEADPGWGIAAWNVASTFASLYDDADFEAEYYPSLRMYMEHWVSIASAHGGDLNFAYYGDWMEFWPGTWDYRPADYSLFFYTSALDRSAEWASRLGHAADAARYGGLAASSRALYRQLFFNASAGCYADCGYTSQLFALTLGLPPHGSSEESSVWSHTVRWFNSTPFGPSHFGGGIVSLSLVYPLLARFGLTDLGLRFQLQTTRPSLGQMVAEGATTLWEGLDQTGADGPGSKNHAMFGSSGAWYFWGLAGLSRAPGSRSWTTLVFAPPLIASGVSADLSFASASVDTPMGRVASAWRALGTGGGTVCGTMYEEGKLTLSCDGGNFSSVAFASFGTPVGDCSSGLFRNASCDAAASVDAVRAACVGRPSCTLWANASEFGGDPCLGVRKSLAVALLGPCSNAAPPAPVFSLSVELPPNAVGTAAVPTPGDPAASIITEGGVPVWRAGAFVPGVPGVAGATAEAAAVVFSLGSGAFSFEVFNAA
jgi:alpha-L-rhamnosidase